MRSRWPVALAFAAAVLLAAVPAARAIGTELTPAERAMVLAHGPWPPEPIDDPSNRYAASPAAIALGYALFNEPRLSRDGSLACASCHQAGRHYTDGRARARGRERLDRNTPTVVDLAGARWFGWGGAHDSLWAQSIRPIVDAREMAAEPAHVRYVLAGVPALACRFEQAFGRLPEDVPGQEVLVLVGKALAAWQASLVSARAAFDHYRDALAAGDVQAMAAYPDDALRGLKRFVGEGRCSLCHFGPRFTNGEFADVGVPYFIERGRVDPGRHGGIKALRADPHNQLGGYNDDPVRAPGTATRHVALVHRNFGEFKVPSLRGVALTAPYMHDGSLATLEDVIRHYSELDPERLHSDGERILAPLGLDAAARADLAAFLSTLTPPGPAPGLVAALAPGCEAGAWTR